MGKRLVLALGTNSGGEEKMMMAERELQKIFGRSVRFSNRLRTKPIDMECPDFINSVASTTTEWPLELIRSRLKEMEAFCGNSTEKRTLNIIEMDIDILMYGDRKFHRNDWQRPYIKQLLEESGIDSDTEQDK